MKATAYTHVYNGKLQSEEYNRRVMLVTSSVTGLDTHMTCTLCMSIQYSVRKHKNGHAPVFVLSEYKPYLKNHREFGGQKCDLYSGKYGSLIGCSVCACALVRCGGGFRYWESSVNGGSTV